MKNGSWYDIKKNFVVYLILLTFFKGEGRQDKIKKKKKKKSVLNEKNNKIQLPNEDKLCPLSGEEEEEEEGKKK